MRLVSSKAILSGRMKKAVKSETAIWKWCGENPAGKNNQLLI